AHRLPATLSRGALVPSQGALAKPRCVGGPGSGMLAGEPAALALGVLAGARRGALFGGAGVSAAPRLGALPVSDAPHRLNRPAHGGRARPAGRVPRAGPSGIRAMQGARRPGLSSTRGPTGPCRPRR